MQRIRGNESVAQGDSMIAAESRLSASAQISHVGTRYASTNGASTLPKMSSPWPIT
jgi:hypothetical protein